MRVGFIGLGTMGQHLAAHLREGGYELVVNDVREEAAAPHLAAGAEWAATPAAVMAASDVVITSLPAPPDVESVALGTNGLIEAAGPDKVFVDMSTNSPTVMRRIYDRFAAVGTSVLDAPVSGGPSGAKSGRLSIFVGGDESVYESLKAMFATMGDQPVYVGAIGAGSVAKLVHNLAAQSVNLAIAEAMSLGVRAGVDPLVLWGAIRKGASGRRRTFDFTRFYTRDFEEPTFRLDLCHKDLSLALALGHELNVPMRLSDLTLDEHSEALGRGWGNRDSSTVFLLQEERAHVNMEIAREDVTKTLAE
jgi:3-hydroxyisobutyrate dehydrogenase